MTCFMTDRTSIIFIQFFKIFSWRSIHSQKKFKKSKKKIITSLEDPYIVELIGRIDLSVSRNESFIKNLYQKGSEHIKKLSETRLIHSTQEIKLFKVLSSFLEKFKMIKDRFGNDSYLQKEFESIGINSFNILRFIESRMHQE